MQTYSEHYNDFHRRPYARPKPRKAGRRWEQRTPQTASLATDPLHTPLCDLLGIRYPVMQAGMGMIARGRLAAAVSEAGGLGVIGSGHLTVDELREEIVIAQQLTDKPFGVDILFAKVDTGGSEVQSYTKEVEDQVQAVLDARVPVLISGLGNPILAIEAAHELGIVVMSVVGTARHAVRLVESGVDAVIGQGHEAGGHTGPVGTIVLIPQLVDSVDVPVVAAGGLADGRGLAASLALGATGVWMGTRFIATEEAHAHVNYKDKIASISEEGTVITRAHSGKPCRLITQRLHAGVGGPQGRDRAVPAPAPARRQARVRGRPARGRRRARQRAGRPGLRAHPQGRPGPPGGRGHHGRRAGDAGADQRMSAIAYAAVEGWEQIPDGVSHPDVADVAVDSRDRVHVFSRAEPPLLVYEPDGTFVRSLGAGLFSDPHGLTIGPDDHLYCADKGDHTVRRLWPDGEVVLTVGTPGHASGTGVGTNPRSVTESAPPFNCPTKVAVLRSGQFYVSDGYGNARVHRFAADGTLEASWGEPGDGPGEFDVPHAVAVSPDERRVYVADRQNDRVQVFDPDGAFLEEWTDVSRPCGLAVDPAGTVFVGELGRRAGVEPEPVTRPRRAPVGARLDLRPRRPAARPPRHDRPAGRRLVLRRARPVPGLARRPLCRRADLGRGRQPGRDPADVPQPAEARRGARPRTGRSAPSPSWRAPR